MTAQAKKRVLIIDDEEDLVEMLAMRLEATDLFEVDKAFDGAAGLERALSSKPDIVLLDNVMPNLDGWEVCRRLRADSSMDGLTIIIMTAGSPARAIERGREARADRVVLKPYEHEELLAILKQEGANAQAS